MIGRSKQTAPGANVSQTKHPSKLNHKGASKLKYQNGKVFRDNAGRPWNRATQLG